MLAAITASIGKCGGSEIYHQRLSYDVPAKLAKIDAVIETVALIMLTKLLRHFERLNLSGRWKIVPIKNGTKI